MGNVDSLSIKVDASARSANQQLDQLVQKMVQLRTKVNGINVGNLDKIADSIQNFSKAVTGLREVKTSDFTRMAKNLEKIANVKSANLDQSAQSVERAAGTLQRASSVARKAISSGLKFDSSGAQDMQKAIKGLANEYSGFGKGKAFEGTLGDLEKTADKLRKELDTLAEREEKALATGSASAGNQTFRNLQFDISKTLNQLSELEMKIKELQGANAVKTEIIRPGKSGESLEYFSKELDRTIKSMETNGERMARLGSLDTPIQNLEIDLQKLRRMYPEARELISSYMSEIEKLRGIQLTTPVKSARLGKGGETPKKEGNLATPAMGGEESFRNYYQEIADLKKDLKGLEESGRMGSDEWEQMYLKLRKVTLEAKEYKNALNRHVAGLDEDIRKTDSLGNQVEELNAKLKELKARGLNFGDGEFDDVYRALQRTTGKLKEYKAVLNKPSTEIDEEVRKTDSLGNRVEGLKAKVKALQEKGLNFGDPKFDSTYKELQKATDEMKKYKSSLTDIGNTTQSVSGKIGNAFRSIWSHTKNVGKGIVDFGSRIKKVTAHFRTMSNSTDSLTKKLAKMFLGFVSLRSGAKFLKDSVEASMDYIEEYNYFNTTMEKIASEWSKDYKKYGYDNAEEYGKSFQGRLTSVMNKMTGFQMNEDGTLTDSGVKNLGLDATQMTNYAAGVAQVTNSVGMTGEASVATSKALSMLAGDMSSFRNLDMKTVMNNFSSGLIGQSRSLYKYGIDITNATLATYAHEMGIKKDISAMTQGEKMQLRMIAILDQSKVAWGDLAKTINSPSNQLRLLMNNFKSLSRTIGNMFLPVVAKVLPYVNGLVIAIRRLFEWTASMLGIKLKDVIGDSGGGYSDAFDGLEEDANNASNAVDDTTDSVKKLAKQLMGFDELNVITTNKDSDKDDDKDGNGKPIDLTDQLSAALADYEKVWNDAYKNMTSDAEKFADKLTKLFKDAWTSGDGTDIGSAIASWINKGIAWVNKNVDTFAAGLKKMAGILATAFNGFVAKLNWEGLGAAIGKSLKAFFDAETHFFDTVDWTNFGKSLARSLNAAIETGVVQSFIKSIASKLRAAIELAFGAITTFNFKGLGKAIGQGINDILDTMGKVNPKTGLNGWQELGVTITEGISGVADTIITALETVHWEDVAQAIADFISSVNMGKIGWKLGKLVGSLATAFYTLVSDKKTWTDLGTKIADGINGFFKGMNDVDPKTRLTGWETLGKSVSDTILGIGTTITTALHEVGWEEVGQTIANFITGIDWTKVAWELVDVVQSFAEALKNVLKGAGMNETLANLVVNVGIGRWVVKKLSKTALGKVISKKIGSKFSVPLKKVGAVIKNWLTNKKDVALSKLKDKIAKGLGKVTTTMKNVGAKVKDWIAESVNKSGLKTKIIDKLGKVSTSLKKVAVTIKDWVVDSAKKIADKIKELMPKRVDTGKKVELGADWKPTGLKDSISTAITGFGSFGISLLVTDIIAGDDAWKKFLGDKSSGWANYAKDKEGYTDKDMEKIEEITKGSWITDFVDAVGKLFGKEEKEINVKYKTDTSELDKANKKAQKIRTIKVTYESITGKNWLEKYNQYKKLKNKTTVVSLKMKYLNRESAALAQNPLLTGKGKKKTIDTYVNMQLKVNGQKVSNNNLKNLATLVSSPGFAKSNPYNVSISKKANGGIFSGGSWHNIAKYAGGGLPGMGQMFIAREAGPEFVGTIGRRTAVMNNNQIVASVSDGVFNALAPVLTSLVNAINLMVSTSSNGNGDVYVEIDGDNIARVVRRKNTDYRKRTGKGMFEV